MQGGDWFHVGITCVGLGSQSGSMRAGPVVCCTELQACGAWEDRASECEAQRRRWQETAVWGMRQLVKEVEQRAWLSDCSKGRPASKAHRQQVAAARGMLSGAQ